MTSIYTVQNKHCFACPRPGSHEKPDVDLVLLGITTENSYLDCNIAHIPRGLVVPYFFTKRQAMTYIDTLYDDVKNDVSTVSYRVVNNPNFKNSIKWKKDKTGATFYSTEPAHLFSAVAPPDQVEEGEYSLTIHILPLTADIENDIRRAIGSDYRAFRFSTTEKPIEPAGSPCVVYHESDESSTDWVYRKSSESYTEQFYHMNGKTFTNWVAGIFMSNDRVIFNRAVAEVNQMQTTKFAPAMSV